MTIGYCHSRFLSSPFGSLSSSALCIPFVFTGVQSLWFGSALTWNRFNSDSGSQNICKTPTGYSLPPLLFSPRPLALGMALAALLGLVPSGSGYRA
ncbi:uncharacterized protein EI90DRAFT_2269561 [Cantharellus anzutake]|uniref:uncharacterized protein n=1 Tax=Cantharellus anzutake TaxID=1750568 RepID=UPI00190527D9|nr:uncharacterized protein EI90DRAFT_2269561 [Cantharellus anzutake]KAF8339677.1 hypothetical protein EI90DRAFT_2269561 [Cantharellus anzutake]